MSSGQRRILEFVLDNLVWFILFVVLAIFSAFVPNYFQPQIFVNIIEQSTVLGVMSIGLAIVIISGHMDLSIESVAALSAMVTGVLFASSGIGLDVGLSPGWLKVPVSILAGLVVGGLIGYLNGVLVVKVKLDAFIVTLAAFIWARGLVVAMSGGRSAQGLASEIRWFAIQRVFGLPVSAYIAIFCFIFFSVMMTRMRFGRHLTLIGGNKTAAFRAGIKVNRVLITAFVMAGVISALAGWLLAIRTSGATANLGMGMLFQAFAAVVIGGVSLKGGIGGVPGVYAGVLLLSSINTAINLLHLPAEYTQVIQGLLVLAAVLLDTLKHSIRKRLA